MVHLGRSPIANAPVAHLKRAMPSAMSAIEDGYSLTVYLENS
jgi:hypothetical protein